MQGVKFQTGKKIHAWDVVNEAMGWDSVTRKWGLKPVDPWYPTLPDYVNKAFTYAREADPDALLFYNDFGVTTYNGKAKAIRNMAEDMISNGVPIDGIGLQMHIHDDSPPTREETAATIKMFGDLGLQVHITELDVKCTKCDGSDAAALSKQADIYVN